MKQYTKAMVMSVLGACLFAGSLVMPSTCLAGFVPTLQLEAERMQEQDELRAVLATDSTRMQRAPSAQQETVTHEPAQKVLPVADVAA